MDDCLSFIVAFTDPYIPQTIERYCSATLISQQSKYLRIVELLFLAKVAYKC